MSIPTDFVVTMSDHGRHKYLIEIRENGRLLLRRWPTVDEVILENAVGRRTPLPRSMPTRWLFLSVPLGLPRGGRHAIICVVEVCRKH